jgi:hypothetical protein
MSSGIHKSFMLLVSASVLATFMISAVIAQQQTKKAAEAPPATAKGAAGTAAVGAQKAKITANQFAVIKLTAIKYTPFTYADLKDPKSGRIPTPTDLVTATNGKQIVASKYLAALNNFEQQLTASGYTLRSAKPVTVQALKYNKEIYTQQVAAAKSLPAITAKAKAVSLASVQQKYQTALNASKAAPAKAATTENEGTKGAKGAKGSAGSAGTGTAGTKSEKSAIARIPPGEVAPIFRGYQPFTTTKSFDKPFGDPSYLYADFNASITFTGDANSASLSAVATAKGAILGDSETLAQATASLSAPKTGNLTANLKITVLGTDEVVVNETKQVSFNQESTYSKSLPDSWKITGNVPIFDGLSVDFTLGVKGSISMPYELSDVPGESIGFVNPDIQASVYGEVGIGVGDDDLGASVGIGGQLTLINNKLMILGTAANGTDSKGPFLNYELTSSDSLTAFSGRVFGFAKVCLPVVGCGEEDSDILNFSRLVASFTPIEAGEQVYLKANAPVNKAN